MTDWENMKRQYWATVARTRKSGRIAGSVRQRMEQEWKRFDEDVVKEALRIHMDRCRDYKENYTIGIMRNLQRKKDATGKIRAENSFNKFMKQDYDIDEIERKLLEKAGREMV